MGIRVLREEICEVIQNVSSSDFSAQVTTLYKRTAALFNGRNFSIHNSK
jgi:hypothetical protein